MPFIRPPRLGNRRFRSCRPALDRAAALAAEEGMQVEFRLDGLDDGARATEVGGYDLILGIFIQIFGNEARKARKPRL